MKILVIKMSGKINDVVKALGALRKNNYSKITLYELMQQAEHENRVKKALSLNHKEKTE